MAKRFISTDLFDDEWFCDLSKDAKLFFIYYITKCDHAGVLRLNKRLFEFQTGVKNFDTLIKEFDNCIVRVKEQLFFMPKFIKFQYPDFPKSNVKQQDGAIRILKELNLWDDNLNTYITVGKELTNSYDNDNVNDNVIVIDHNKRNFDFFEDFEKCILREQDIENFKNICNEFVETHKRVQQLSEPLTSFDLYRLINKYGKIEVLNILDNMENYKPLLSKSVSAYKTANVWLRKDKK
jgi:hypothetical protein